PEKSRDVDDLGPGELIFEFGDTDLVNFLLRLRRLILRVFSKVWFVCYGILNPLNNAHSFELRASSHLFYKSRMPRRGHWKFAHGRMLMQSHARSDSSRRHNVRLVANTRKGRRLPRAIKATPECAGNQPAG